MVIYIKTIGIIIRPFKENKKSFIGTRSDLFKTLYKYDVNLIGIPININYKKLIESIKLCDGIILSGGDNLQENDLLLIEYLYKKNIPTLGICLGMQAMSLYFSNNKEINIDNHLSNNKYVHYININTKSLLYKILNKERILVNSRHKSAIKDTQLTVSAKSDDFVIEAVEDINKKFFLGVEWHPESLNDDNTNKLFEYFANTL